MLNLIIKDFKVIIYDVKSLMFILVMPIALMSILGMALQGVFDDTMSSEVFSVQIGVVKEYDYQREMNKVTGQLDSGTFAEADLDLETLESMSPEAIFFDEFLENDELKSFMTYEIMDLDQANKQLESGDIDAVVVLPTNYIYNGYLSFLSPSDIRYETRVDIIKSSDPNRDFYANMVEMIITSFYRNIDQRIAMNKAALDVAIGSEFINDEMMSQMIDEMMNTEMEGAVIASENIPGSKSISSFQYYAVAIMAMFIMYSASTGARALFQETKEHTYQRLKVSGNTTIKMLISNFFRVALIVITQSFIMMIYTSLALKVDWGNPLNQVIVLLLSGIAVSSVGTFIAIISLKFDNVKLANMFEFAVVQMMALLGGSFIPIEVLPEGFQKISFLSLNASVLGGYLNGMNEKPISNMSSDIVYMFLFTGIFVLASFIVTKLKGKESAA